MGRTELGALGAFPFMPVAMVVVAVIGGVVTLKVTGSEERRTRIVADAQRYVADQGVIAAQLENQFDLTKVLLYGGLGVGGALILSALIR